MIKRLIDNEELMKEYNYKKNTNINLASLALNSHKKVWWKCSKCGNEWETRPYSRVAGHNCPKCALKKVSKSNIKTKTKRGINDLQTLSPIIASEWNYEKNKEYTPYSISNKSNKIVWWKCNYCNHEWKAKISSRTSNISGCPACAKESHSSIPEQIIYYYIKKKFPDAINSYTPEWLNKSEIDIYIPSLKLAIEYDGERWHRDIIRDIEKNKTIILNGIKIIRVREPNLPKLNDKSINISIDKISSNYKYMDDVVKEIFNFIDKNINIDILVERDLYKIIENSIYNKNKDIVHEWDYEKNLNLSPKQVSINSGIKVWWKCSKCGNDWQATPNDRNRKCGCPACAGRYVLGITDLKTRHPELLKEWNYEKNEKKPEDYNSGSLKKVWWKCSNGHEWETTIKNRTTKKTGCPVCSNRLIKKGINDLETTNPELVLEWDYKKNGILKPYMFSKGSEKKVWWICPKCNISYESYIKHRTNGVGCPKCGIKKANETRNKTIIKNGENSFGNLFPSLLLEWDYNKNKDFSPYEITANNNRKVWWKCSKCGNEWETTISIRARGSGCPECSKIKVMQKNQNNILKNGENSFGKKCKKILLKEWNYSKNIISPFEIAPSSHKKVWWKCSKCGNEWETIIKNRTNGSGCPKCSKNHN